MKKQCILVSPVHLLFYQRNNRLQYRLTPLHSQQVPIHFYKVLQFSRILQTASLFYYLFSVFFGSNVENPWHGGPPKTIRGSFPFHFKMFYRPDIARYEINCFVLV